MCADKPGVTNGEQDRLGNRVPALGKKASKPLAVKTCGIAAVVETPSLTGEFIGETHRVLEHTQTHPPGTQHQKGPICLWVVGEVTESPMRAQQVALFPLGPHIQHHNAAKWVASLWQTPKDPHLTT